MKFNLVLILIATICLGGCGVDEIKEDKKEVKLPELELSANQNGTVDERFFSKDRKVEQILEDFEKPLMSYPKIWQEEAVIKKNGRLYRKGRFGRKNRDLDPPHIYTFVYCIYIYIYIRMHFFQILKFQFPFF